MAVCTSLTCIAYIRHLHTCSILGSLHPVCAYALHRDILIIVGVQAAVQQAKAGMRLAQAVAKREEANAASAEAAETMVRLRRKEDELLKKQEELLAQCQPHMYDIIGKVRVEIPWSLHLREEKLLQSPLPPLPLAPVTVDDIMWHTYYFGCSLYYLRKAWRKAVCNRVTTAFVQKVPQAYCASNTELSHY